MGRPVLAFVVAPLWLPAISTLFLLFRYFPTVDPRMVLSVWPAIVVIAIVAYLFTLTFGLPVFLLLRRRGRVALWFALLWAFCVGLAAAVVLKVLLTPFYWHGLRSKWPHVLKGLRDAPIEWIVPGLVGVLVALTIAYIAVARPRAKLGA